MNTEPSTPSCTQQNSPSMPIQQLTAINTDLHHLAAATQPSPMVSYGLTQSHIDSAVTLPLGTSMNGAMAFKSATAYHSAQPFSPPMDFASMNIASGYPTPVSATPVSVPHPQQQQQKAEHDSTKPATKSNSVAAKASVSPAATSVAGTSTGEKPEFSYASLIAQSLLNAPMQRRTLNGIYEWIQERFPYYRSRQNWQNSIRHNLSLNKGFMKVKRDDAHPGKGSFWTFTPGYESCLNGGHFKPIRSRSGRAALAAATALAAANSPSAGSVNSDLSLVTGSLTRRRSTKKGEKKTSRAIKNAKSLKRSHSVPPKDQQQQQQQQGANTTATSAAAGTNSGLAKASLPAALAHSDSMPLDGNRKPAKKMRVSSSQSNTSAVSSMLQSNLFNNSANMSLPQTPYAPSPVFHASSALLNNSAAGSMSMASNASHTSLPHPAQFNFQMQQSSCAVPMPITAMDLASVPSTATGGPYMGAMMGSFGEPVSGMDGSTGYFAENAASANDVSIYATIRRTATPNAHSNMPSRISWHGPESLAHAFTTLQQQQQEHQVSGMHQANSLGVSMGPSENVDFDLAILNANQQQQQQQHNQCVANGMSVDTSVNQQPMDWSMLTGVSAPASGSELSTQASQLHHVTSGNSIGTHQENGLSVNTATAHGHGHSHSHSVSLGISTQQQRVASLAAMEAASAGPLSASISENNVNGGGNGNQNMMAFYDEMMRDPSSLVNVLGQDLAGWQCPTTKTNTIDPAALCAVDPETNNNTL